MNINEFIFTRTAPAKKIEIVKTLSQKELLSVRPDTIKRIIREVGSNRYKSRDKSLRISDVGNNWNSTFDGVETCKGNLYVELYLQYENIDTSTSESFEKFFCKGEYRGSVVRSDRYGNPRYYYFTYTEADKAECVRMVLLTYLHLKYKERLTAK